MKLQKFFVCAINWKTNIIQEFLKINFRIVDVYNQGDY